MSYRPQVIGTEIENVSLRNSIETAQAQIRENKLDIFIYSRNKYLSISAM